MIFHMIIQFVLAFELKKVKLEGALVQNIVKETPKRSLQVTTECGNRN